MMRFFILSVVMAGACTAVAKEQPMPVAWVQRYDPNSTVLQEGNGVATDSRGNVAVTGARFIGSNEAYYTAKYARATGALLWEETYDSGNGDDVPSSVAMDSEGNVIVTGYRTNAGGFHDYYTIKYASANGAIVWQRFYEGPNGGLDEAVKVVVDSADNVIVTGISAGAGTGEDIHTLKYRASDGLILNQWRYNSPANRGDRPTDLAVDGSDNVIVVGEANLGDEAWFYTGRYHGTGAPGAIHWERVRDDLPSPSFYGALGVALDSAGNVFTVGRLRRGDITFESLTIKYAAANGATLWDEFSGDLKLNSANDPIDIAVDSAGDAIIGVTLGTPFGNSIGVIKYAGADGAFIWGRETTPPGDDDTLTAVAVDQSNNVIAAGTSRNDLQVGASDDYYVLKLRPNGDFVFQDRRNGDNESGEDTVRGLAVDRGGNIIVTGRSRKDEEVQGNTFQMLTVKYGLAIAVDRFLVATGDPAPGSAVPEGSTIGFLGTPAVADTNAFVVRAGINAGKNKRFDTIFFGGANGGSQSLPAVAGDPAPGVTGGTFKSFSSPVIAPNARFAFVAKLRGVPGSEDSGVWTTAFNGALQLALQEGKAVPGLPSETRLRSVSGISLRNGHLLALIQIAGAEVNGGNDTVLLGQTSSTVATPLLRTGTELTIDGETSTIRTLTVFTPAKGSGGHGRYHADSRSVARVTLADKRTVLFRVEHDGTLTSLLFRGAPASDIASGSVWKTLGLPVIGSEGSNYAAAGTLAEGDVSKSDDLVVVYSTTGAAFVLIAREGDVAPDETGARPGGSPIYRGFSDPVVNDQVGAIAFLGVLDGPGVKGSTKTALWFRSPGGMVKRVARLGEKAPDSDGMQSDAVFSAFTSIALPGGPDSAPIFLAKIKGPGVTGRNNFGLWSVDATSGAIRKLLGTGDIIGEASITRLILLQPIPTVQGATRSFNAGGTVIVHLTLSDKRQALLNLDLR